MSNLRNLSENWYGPSGVSLIMFLHLDSAIAQFRNGSWPGDQPNMLYFFLQTGMDRVALGLRNQPSTWSKIFLTMLAIAEDQGRVFFAPYGYFPLSVHFTIQQHIETYLRVLTKMREMGANINGLHQNQRVLGICYRNRFVFLSHLRENGCHNVLFLT